MDEKSVKIRYCPVGRRYPKAPVEMEGTLDDVARLLMREDVAMLWADEGEGMVRLK